MKLAYILKGNGDDIIRSNDVVTFKGLLFYPLLILANPTIRPMSTKILRILGRELFVTNTIVQKN